MLVFRCTLIQALLLALSLVVGAILGWMYSLAVKPFPYSVLFYGPGGAFFALITAANVLGLGQPRSFWIPPAWLRWLLRAGLLLMIVVFVGAFIEHLGKPPPRWELPKTDESVIAAPADGRFIITCANLSKMEFHQYSGPIRVRDSSTGQIQSACLPGERIYDLLLSQNGTHLAVMCANGILKVFNLQKGEVEGEMPYFDTEEGKREVVTRSSSGYWAFSHAGRMLAFAIERNAEDSKGQIVLWDAETRKFTVLCERDVRQILAFSPDGRFLVLCSWHFKGCLIEFWDTTRNQIDHTFEKDELVSELVFSPSGNAILAKGGPQPFANEVWFMDPITGSKGMELANLADFEFAPDGETILAVSSPSRAITRFDTATGKRMSEVRIPILFRAVLIPHTPAVVTQQDDRIAFWDIPPRRPLWWIVGGIGFPLVLILMLATGSRSLLRKPAEPHNSLVETEAVGN